MYLFFNSGTTMSTFICSAVQCSAVCQVYIVNFNISIIIISFQIPYMPACCNETLTGDLQYELSYQPKSSNCKTILLILLSIGKYSELEQLIKIFNVYGCTVHFTLFTLLTCLKNVLSPFLVV